MKLRQTRELSELEQQGLIQAFEYTHELAWKVMKDYLRSLGNDTGGIDLSLLSHIDNPALLDHIARVGKSLWTRESAHSGTSQ